MMAWHRVVPVAGLALAALGCDALTGPSQTDRLAEAVLRWDTAAYPSYEFEMMRHCYCGLVDVGQRVTVTVVDNEVVSAKFTETDQPIEGDPLASLPTVPALFAMIAGAITQKAHRLDVSYHPVHGAPSSISVDYRKNADDDELAVTIFELRGPDA
ncbi:MAG: DUF6174 domain-containing protein [Gemmatimonadales bacterium]